MELVKRYKEKELLRNNIHKGLMTLSIMKDGVSTPIGEVKDFEINYGERTAVSSSSINRSNSEITIGGELLSEESREALLGISSSPGNLTSGQGITTARIDASYLDNNSYGNVSINTTDAISLKRNMPNYYGLESPNDTPIGGDMMIADGGKLMYYASGSWREITNRVPDNL